MKKFFKKVFHDIKEGYKEDDKTCKRYPAFGVFNFFLALIFGFVIFAGGLFVGRHGCERPKTLKASAEEVIDNETVLSVPGTPSFNNPLMPYQVNLDKISYAVSGFSNGLICGLYLPNAIIFAYDGIYFDVPTTQNPARFIFPYVNINPYPTSDYVFEFFLTGHVFASNSYSGLASQSVARFYLKDVPIFFTSESASAFFSQYYPVSYRCVFDLAQGPTLGFLLYVDFGRIDNANETLSTFCFELMIPLSSGMSYFEVINTFKNENTFIPSTYYQMQAFLEGYSIEAGADIQNSYNLGYEKGYSIGNDLGLRTGESIGYAKGLKTAESGTFVNAVSSVLGAPVIIVKDFLNFSLLGVNMLAFLSGLFTLLIIFKLIKMVL